MNTRKNFTLNLVLVLVLVLKSKALEYNARKKGLVELRPSGLKNQHHYATPLHNAPRVCMSWKQCSEKNSKIRNK